MSRNRNALYRALFGPANRVLMYHSIGGGLWDHITTARFRTHLELLTQHFSVVDLPAVLNHDSDEKRVALTFDDGYADFYENALPLLVEFDVPATVFLIGQTLTDPDFAQDDIVPHRYMPNDTVYDLVDEPLVTVGSHTLEHPDLTQVDSDSELQSEIVGGKEVIEDYLDVTVDRFAYPYNALDERCERVVSESHTYGVCGGGEGRLISRETSPSAIPRVNGARKSSVVLIRMMDWSARVDRFL